MTKNLKPKTCIWQSSYPKMKTKMTIKNQKGAAAVEFAIILPLLLVLLFGIVEFSILFYNKAMITNASCEGARAGIVFAETRLPQTDASFPDCPSYILEWETNSNCPSIECVVCRYASEHLINFNPSQVITTTAIHFETGLAPESAGTISSGDSLEVKVQYTYGFLVFPNLAKLFGGSFNPQKLEAVTVMRYE